MERFVLFAAIGVANVGSLVMAIEGGSLRHPLVAQIFVATCYVAGVGLHAWGEAKRVAVHDTLCCGACGYSLHGIDSARCPECGHETACTPKPTRIYHRKNATYARGCGVALALSPVIVLIGTVFV